MQRKDEPDTRGVYKKRQKQAKGQNNKPLPKPQTTP